MTKTERLLAELRAREEARRLSGRPDALSTKHRRQDQRKGK